VSFYWSCTFFTTRTYIVSKSLNFKFIFYPVTVDCDQMRFPNDLFSNLIFPKAYVSVGCYATQNSCGNDVFVEYGISDAQCTNAQSTLPGVSCDPNLCSYYGVDSVSIMTIELCLQVCNSNGFTYAGLCSS